MTDIEISKELLQGLLKGDEAAKAEAKKLLKEETLFGRWATHPEYGRILFISEKADASGLIRAMRRNYRRTGGVQLIIVDLENCAFDPLELTTVEDFENAPKGTIVTCKEHLMRKRSHIWHSHKNSYNCYAMAMYGTWQVVRWGGGQ